MNKPQKSQLTNKVISNIRDGQIKMQSKAHFALKSGLIVLGIFLVALFILYLISFIIFALRASGAWYLPSFGFSGIKTSLILLPWLLILIAVILMILLEVLVKRFSFAYRQPVFYSILSIIIFTLLGGFIVSQTPLHSNLFQKAKEKNLPIAGEFYRGFGMAKNRDTHRGIISETTETGYYLETRCGETLDIIITSETHFPSETKIEKDDTVVVLGKRNNGVVHALGIREIDDNLKRRTRLD